MNNFLFENEKATAYLRYIAGNFAKDYFKGKIEKLDTSNIYIKVQEVQDIDPADVEKEKDKYKPQMKLVEDELKAWRDKHKDYYRMQPSLPTSSIYSEFIPDISCSLEEAVQGYKGSNALLKLITNNDLDKFCIETKPMLNAEHKEEYNNTKQFFKDYYKIPSDEDIKNSLTKKNIVKSRLSLNRQPVENEALINKFLEEFTENLRNIK